jgi:hypothetical protein
MKKILQSIFCYRTIEVTDVSTATKEKATYFLLLGLAVIVTYKPV